MALTDEDVGRNVRDLRIARGMTQAALAARVYLARTSVSRLENGQRAVTVPELATIAASLGVDVAYLAVPSRTEAPATEARSTHVLPVAAEISRPRLARVMARRSELSAAFFAFFRTWFKKTKPLLEVGHLSKAEQNWDQMIRNRHMSLGRLDIARYSGTIRDPETRRTLKYAG